MQIQLMQTKPQDQAQSLAQAPMSQMERDRRRQQDAAWKAYQGEFQKPLKVAANQPDDNVLSNRCSPIVDKGVSFLFGQTLKIETTGEAIAEANSSEYAANGNTEDLDPKGIQAFIDGLWGDDDDRMTLFAKMAINGGAFGQVFAKLIPASGNMQYPRIVNLDPRIVRIVTSPEDCDLHLAYVIEYPGLNDTQKRQVIARVDPDDDLDIAGADIKDYWTITNYIKRGQLANWIQVGEAEEWPYPFAPIFTWQNLPNPNEPIGKADLTPDIIQLNNVINFIQSNTSRIIKFHAHPRTWGKGFRASQLSIAVDETFVIEAPDGMLQNLEMTSNLDSSRAFADDIRADMDEQSRVPAVALGRIAALPRGNISGVALQLLFQPLIEKTVQKQRLYGCGIRAITRAALVLAGKLSIEEWEDYPIDLHWQNLLPVDDLAAAQTAVLLKQVGVSDATIQSQLGYDPDAEVAKSAEEDQRKVTAYSRGVGLPPPPPNRQPIESPNEPPATGAQNND